MAACDGTGMNENHDNSGPIPIAPTAALMARRFRGFLPVVIDVECGGFNPATDALLEIAAVAIEMNEDGTLRRGETHSYHVKPFEGARLDPAALQVTGIDPWHPLRPSIPERDALQRIFREVRHAIRAYTCRRAILVGHNAAFDLAFLNAAVARTEIKRNPFHPFSWDASSAHSAAYDAERSADIFCLICNRLRDSYRAAEERACELGWLDAPPTEPVSEDPQMET
jgi:ribonuclease T